MLSITEELDAICARIVQADEPTKGEDELEPKYEELLNFLVLHQSHREVLLQRLFAIMRGYRTSRERQEPLLPATAIAYAMHELRWPEVLQFAKHENDDFWWRSKSTVMTEIMDAYGDDWEDKVFYRRFSK